MFCTNTVNEADDRFIHLVYVMMKEDQKEVIIRNLQGIPLSQSQYKSEIDKTRKQYEKGIYISDEELEKRTT